MPPPLILDPTTLDLNRVVVDREGLRQVNPQRHEMEQLDAVVLIDREQHIIAGYKDVREDEFWARGHMPGYPLLPGVLMCEAGAQLVGYYTVVAGYREGDFIGFGGLDDVRFRGVVKPGDRFVLVGKAIKLHRRQTHFNVQGFVGSAMVFHGVIMGIQLYRKDAQSAEG